MDRVVKKSEPHLFDLAFSWMQDALADGLPWLDHVLPSVERLVKVVMGRKVYTPNIYTGGNDYELVTPDVGGIGNYSFFVLDEPQQITYDAGGRASATSSFSLVVWLDIRTVDAHAEERNIEGVKRDILRAVRGTWMRDGEFTITKVYQRAEKVFSGFSLDEVDNQFLMHPYCGFRFVGEITIKEECAL